MNGNPELPSPVDYPAADIVIYDGKCQFCLAQVQRLQWWDGGKRLSFISLHDDFVSQNVPDLTYDEMMQQMYIVERKTGVAHGGARALRYLTRRLPRLWFAMPFLHVPFTLGCWQWTYQEIAKRRYRLSVKKEKNCDNGACDIHSD